VFGVIAWVLAFVVAGFVVVFVAREERKSLEKYAREDEEAQRRAEGPAGDPGPPNDEPKSHSTDTGSSATDRGSSPGSAP
jgi:hypothetical protein